MSGRRLTTTVHVHQDDGTVVVYGPGDMVPEHDAARILNPDVWDGDEVAVEPAPPSSQAPVGEPTTVPDGSADDVLAWVGDDPVRAALAQQAEAERPKARTGLLARLDRIAGTSE